MLAETPVVAPAVHALYNENHDDWSALVNPLSST